MEYLINVRFTSDWVIGSGKEAGAYADLVVEKDADGLPYVPVGSLKGILRDAFMMAAENAWLGDDIEAGVDRVKKLFGSGDSLGRESQTLLKFSRATLSQRVKQSLKGDKRKKLKFKLYRTLQSTAINSATGVADNRSLRTMETVVPLTLTGRISLNQDHPDYQSDSQMLMDFRTLLQPCLNLISEMGGKRRRGFGSVEITAIEQVSANQGG